MSGRYRCLHVSPAACGGLSALVFVLCLGGSCACGDDNGADKNSVEPAQPQAEQFAGLEVLKRPAALKKGETISTRAAIRRALETRVRIEFDEVALDEVCEAIKKQLRIPVVLDRRALGDEGLDPETPVSCSLSNDRLRSVLDLMLSNLDMTWTINCQVLLLTTTTAAQELLDTRVYDVTDLAASSEPGYTDIGALVELITTIISPESWSEVGGEGSIPAIEGRGIRAIVISQTFQIHNEIEKLLAALRAHIPKKADEKGKDADGNKPTAASEEETIRRALRKQIEIDFNETPLDEVVEHLKKLLKIEIQLHKRSLGDEGLDIDTPISFQVSGISAAAAMDLMLRDLDLTYTIKDNYLQILTESAEEELSLSVKLYDVADLVDDHDGFDLLIEAITSTISPESWDIVGGPGCIASFNNAGMRVIAVRLTQRMQNDIGKLLADLRKVKREVDDGLTAQHVIRSGGVMIMGGSGMGRFRPSERRSARHRTRKPKPVEKFPARDFLVEDSNQFAFNLYAKLRDGKPNKNLFFSPMSISTAMSMVHAGVRGKTAEEIAQAMNFKMLQKWLNPACQSLLEISQRGSGHELKIANRLWAQRDYKFLDDFLAITKNHYGAECGLVDFVDKPEAAAKEINTWVAKQTKNLIRNIIGPGDLDVYTRLVLINAIYFKGQWSEPFEVRDTKPAPFFAEEGERQVKMMSMLDLCCKYAQIDDAGLQILEKPYDEWFGLSMMILLPQREPGSLAKLEAALTEEKLAAWSKRLQRGMVMIHMPKFRLETGYTLNKQLMEMGMRLAFNPGADFSGMDGTRDLFLRKVIHKAFVEVDERGTEAAAATTVVGGFVGGFGGMIPTKPLEFRADHPFVFLIRDNRTGSILFLGRFCGPEGDGPFGGISGAPGDGVQRGGGMF